MDTRSDLPAVGNYPGGVRQQFCVSWNSHQSNMHSAFPKLLTSEQFVDVTLACDGDSIKCHKVVLSACSDYLERLLLDIPSTHPIIFLNGMRMWELQALVEFMYRGEVYVEQQRLEKLMQAADALQIRGLSSQGRETNQSESSPQQNPSNEPSKSPLPTKQSSSSYKQDEAACVNTSNSSFVEDNSSAVSPGAANSSVQSTPSGDLQSSSSSNFVNIEHTEALQHLEKALSACEATLTETQGMVKMEPDEQFTQQQEFKPYSISMVQSNSNCSPSSAFPTIDGYQKRQRRSEHELKQASDLVARGMTFQVASERYKIPISTIRFFMARKGILPRRKRGRGTSQHGVNSQPRSPASPPYHMMNYRLPESLNSSLQ